MTAMFRHFRTASAVLALTLAPTIGLAQPPAWFLEEIGALSADGGRWIADNSAFKSPEEPFEAYGIVWVAGFDGVTMTGRLFGIREGVETPAFWEFRQYWHPGAGEARLDQFGWGGVLGTGPMSRQGDLTVTDQIFYRPDGSSYREGHRARFSDSDTHVTESFDIVDGVWSARRKYTWKREKPRG